MKYFNQLDDSEFNFNNFFCYSVELADFIEMHRDTILKYFQLLKRTNDWDTFFYPNISITEINNPNMGHIYLGKIRIPVFFAGEKFNDYGKPLPNALTFVVCKYSEYPGEEHKEKRYEIAYQKAVARLKKNYPERFPDEAPVCDKSIDFEQSVKILPKKVEYINEFLSLVRRG